MNISNTTFNGFYEDNTIGLVGAGLYSLSSNTYVDGCTFQNNMATNGAGIYFDCSDATSCDYTIQNSKFINNTALNDGASFQFDIFPPTLSNNTFNNNTAPYGPNEAGQAYQIINMTDPTTDTYVSGQAITT